jgi:predicted metal-dependent hydrolase
MSYEIKLIRSPRRQRTVGARLVNGVVEVRVPSRMGEQEAHDWARRMAERLTRRQQLGPADDAWLAQRAADLNRRYFGGRLRWNSIRFVTNQNTVNGSCSPRAAEIRLSHRMTKVPRWVCDYVIVHELAHLIHPNHSPAFWKEVQRYPLSERARGYLMALALEPDPEADA